MAARTDLACEAYELHKNSLPDGIFQSEEWEDGLRIVTVTVDTDEAGALIGKPSGRYITVETPPFSDPGDPDMVKNIAAVVASRLALMLPPEDTRGTVLVAGLGNRGITPDSLGPAVAEQVFPTRHIDAAARSEFGLGDFGNVAVISPGVLGQTGVETGELISAVAARLEPSAVVVIDALAAMDASRLGRTVQLSDSGISPGSGVMNSRRRIDRELLGATVISIGVPTVVDASELSGGDASGRPMMITPREIDVIIKRASEAVALGINRALHPRVPPDDLLSLLA